MSDAPESAPPVSGGSATAVRLFGWGVLGVLGAFLVNNFLTIGLDWPGVLPLFGTEETSGESWAQAGIYAIALAAAISFCLYFKQRDLRSDAALISNFNAYLIRGCFWAVLLVGVADMAISFLRVEGFLADVVGAEFATQLGRSMYRGPNIHIPLLIAGFIIALYSRGLGFTWLALMIVVAELVIVITRFVFSYEQAFMGDLMRFWYAALFLFASAYTLPADGHVRVDVFYTNFTTRRKGIVNAIGSVLLGMSVCWAILIVGMSSPYRNHQQSVDELRGLTVWLRDVHKILDGGLSRGFRNLHADSVRELSDGVVCGLARRPGGSRSRPELRALRSDTG